MTISQTTSKNQLPDEHSEAANSSKPLPVHRQIDPDVRRLIADGLNSRQIGEKIGVNDRVVRDAPSWKAHAADRKRQAQNENKNESHKQKKKARRKYGSISVPRAKADVLESLKQSGARLADELMRSPNSYQCNYFLIKRETETICALLKRFLVEE